MPYAGNEDKLIAIESLTDSNEMYMIFCLPNDFQRFQKKSLNMIYSLTNHKGNGSLYQCLKSLNYAKNIDLALNAEVTTAFRFITITLSLT